MRENTDQNNFEYGHLSHSAFITQRSFGAQFFLRKKYFNEWRVVVALEFVINLNTLNFLFFQTAGKYIYTEASIRQENETALLGSPTIAATQTNYYAGSSCKVRFWYHMYGKHIGTLTVYTATQYGVPEKQVWQLSGDQGNTWKRGEADLTNSKDFQVLRLSYCVNLFSKLQDRREVSLKF